MFTVFLFIRKSKRYKNRKWQNTETKKTIAKISLLKYIEEEEEGKKLFRLISWAFIWLFLNSNLKLKDICDMLVCHYLLMLSINPLFFCLIFFGNVLNYIQSNKFERLHINRKFFCFFLQENLSFINSFVSWLITFEYFFLNSNSVM